MKTGLLLGALWAVVPSVYAVVVYSDDGVLGVTRPKNVAINQVRDAVHFSNLRVRASPQTIATFDLSSTIAPGNILSVNPGSEEAGVEGTITASCSDCFTTGSGTAVSQGVKFDDSEFKNPFTAAEEFFKNPGGLIQGAFSDELDVNVSNFTGHFDLDLSFDGEGTYTIPIPLPPTPGEVNFPEPPLGGLAPSATVGLVPSIDVILTVSGKVDMTAGFEFSFPKDATFSLDPIGGDLISTNFGDVQFNALPIKLQSGSGTFTAQLRLGVKLAFDFSAFGSGVTLESGVFADVPTYSATLAFNSTADCAIQLSELLAVDLGAFATAAASIDSAETGVGPTVVTTVATLDLPGTCLSSNTPATASAAPTSAAAAASKQSAPNTASAASAPTTVSAAPTGYWNATAVYGYAPTTAAPAAIITVTQAVTRVDMSNPISPSWLPTYIIGPYVTGTPMAPASTM